MNRFILTLLLLIIGLAPASAQFNVQIGPDPDYYGRPYPQQRYRQPPPQEYYEQEEYRPRYRRVQYGTVCITARGACPAGRPVPINTSCSCNIPGFGLKRGAVGE